MGHTLSKPGPVSELHACYDYIIVGGGAAGCVIAARLSEDPDVTVALLEVGGEETANPQLHVPLLAPVIDKQSTPEMIDYHLEPHGNSCKSMENKTPTCRAGKVLGGGSSVNYMVYMRGSRHDYDDWAANGCDGWRYCDIEKYFMKAETDTNPDHTIEDGHGKDGPITLTESTGFPKTTAAFLKSAEQLGYPIVDSNACKELGVGVIQENVSKGHRNSTVTAYLRPAMSRPNLHVLTSASVTKVLLNGSRAVGVRYTHGETELEVQARREIVICAGAIESPKLLMLSGIGPRNHLENMGIRVVADLPVGEGFQDHVFTEAAAATLTDADGATTSNFTSWTTRLLYNVFGKGHLSQTVAAGMCYLRSAHQPKQDPRPHIMLIAAGGLFSHPDFAQSKNLLPEVHKALYGGLEDSDGVTLLGILSHPVSRGTVRLASSNPKDPPIIDANYLASDDDVSISAEAIRIGRKLLQMEPFKALGAEVLTNRHPGCAGCDFDSDTYWEEYVRNMVFSMSHFCGTCRMGAPHDPEAVVDPQLRVRGVQGLRVADASIMPKITSGNTHAPTVMIAEKAANMIRHSSFI